jgi:acetyltransferase-like isoleucine patch superfamily enzyme
MILANGTKKPKIHSSAYVAPTAVVSGEVTIGQGCAVLHCAVVVAEGMPVTIGNDCVVAEHALVKSTATHPAKIGDEVLVGPHASVIGVTLSNGTRLPANEVRLPAGDPYGATKAYAETLRKIHAKETAFAAHEKAPEAPVEADTVVDVMMLELQEMEHRRAEAKRKK